MIRFTGVTLLPACLAVLAGTAPAAAWERLTNDRLAAIYGGADGNGNGNGNGNIGDNNGNNNNGNNNGNGNGGNNNGNGNNGSNNGNNGVGNGQGNFTPGNNAGPNVNRLSTITTGTGTLSPSFFGINPFVPTGVQPSNGPVIFGPGINFGSPFSFAAGASLNGPQPGR